MLSYNNAATTKQSAHSFYNQDPQLLSSVMNLYNKSIISSARFNYSICESPDMIYSNYKYDYNYYQLSNLEAQSDTKPITLHILHEYYKSYNTPDCINNFKSQLNYEYNNKEQAFDTVPNIKYNKNNPLPYDPYNNDEFYKEYNLSICSTINENNIYSNTQHNLTLNTHNTQMFLQKNNSECSLPSPNTYCKKATFTKDKEEGFLTNIIHMLYSIYVSLDEDEDEDKYNTKVSNAFNKKAPLTFTNSTHNRQSFFAKIGNTLYNIYASLKQKCTIINQVFTTADNSNEDIFPSSNKHQKTLCTYADNPRYYMNYQDYSENEDIFPSSNKHQKTLCTYADNPRYYMNYQDYSENEDIFSSSNKHQKTLCTYADNPRYYMNYQDYSENEDIFPSSNKHQKTLCTYADNPRYYMNYQDYSENEDIFSSSNKHQKTLCNRYNEQYFQQNTTYNTDNPNYYMSCCSVEQQKIVNCDKYFK
ncbi:hypothetical protein [Neoehrlichia mikurensis]|uniref:Uncharacterized protein n=1 Tax=Neoehrlichia mikurensis TaxID=89586 RepID=A0ABY5F0I1_9RICK|nr:hypothetical protein [Neoehrlichia mikurensis]UTO56595.1 hypothetical protein LUA81_01135 [Neoehrlichia mikurensis]